MAVVTGRMSGVELVQILNKIVADLAELRTEYNALRADVLAHDHGSTYTNATIRINASPDTPSGTVTSNAADAMTHTTLGVPPA